ncbi:potassium/proton antiporter [Virgibacillus salinus]|uniref:Potassium/proton antiporter, CPA1 family n=1 Tax=Virgibacillus salinus TaxID=553311 RepID=A0A1H1B0I2_9BACI|nr:potassium/proton antiporter [Virgibacillus salinus]SDQ45429.1 potassium/proton antiporter, CPA1 family [Virgibacillus salinus]
MLNEILESNQFILLMALLLIISVLVTKFSTRLGVPSLVLFIGVGMLVGSDGLNIIYFDNATIAQLIGIIALVVILFEGGLQTQWTKIKPVLPSALTMATSGVLVTTGIVAVASKYMLGISWLEGLLLGSIVGSTDAAAVFAVLKDKNIKGNIKSMLEAESGSNDPMAMFLTLSFIQLITQDQAGIGSLIWSFFWQMGIGLLCGLIIGKVGSLSINRINLDSSGLYPLFGLAFAFSAYSITALMDASGLLAVYTAALVIGNSELTYRHSIVRFNEGFAWMAQIVMFVILGLFVFPAELFQWNYLINGLLVSTVLIFIARPLAVYLNLLKSQYNNKEKLFLSWAGLRGAVPIVLSIFPMLAGVEGSQVMFNVVFFVVLTSTLVQGSTITFMSSKLGLEGEAKERSMHSLELISIGKTNVEMIEYDVTSKNKIIGETLECITLPDNALINAIIRDNEIITPNGQTVIKEHDTLYILVSRKSKQKLIKVLEKDTDTL